MRHYKTLFFGATGLMAASLTLGTLGLGVDAAWASGNQPPGNNGTVKIDEYTVDPGQDNDPHVSCGFTVSFYGYDGGTQNGSISITPVAPTAGDQTFTRSTSWTTPSRTSGRQLDQQVQISGADLASTLEGVTPQAQQGYHLRLEVEVTGSQGSDDKYKVFWMQPCTDSGSSAGPTGTPASPPSTPPTTAPTTSQPGQGGQAGQSSGGSSSTVATTVPASVAAAGTSTKTATLGSGSAPSAATGSAAPSDATPTATPAVLATDSASAPDDAGPFAALSGDHSTAVPTSGDRPSTGSLAFTGASIGALVALGLGLITAGLLLTRRWRRAAA